MAGKKPTWGDVRMYQSCGITPSARARTHTHTRGWRTNVELLGLDGVEPAAVDEASLDRADRLLPVAAVNVDHHAVLVEPPAELDHSLWPGKPAPISSAKVKGRV